jgi:predicted transcriptional regulator
MDVQVQVQVQVQVHDPISTAIYNRVIKGISEKTIIASNVVSLVSQIKTIVYTTYDFLEINERHDMVILTLLKITCDENMAVTRMFSEAELANAKLMTGNPNIIRHMLKNIDVIEKTAQGSRKTRFICCTK